MPRIQHGRALQKLAARLDPADADALVGGWWIAIEPGVRLSSHGIVGPDLAGWRKDRLAERPDDWPLDLRPDWVCEVLSPSNAWYDRGPKAQAYAEAGIPGYWLVDPQQRTVEVMELRDGRWSLLGCHTDGAHEALPPFGDLELAVGELFAPRVSEPSRVAVEL